MLGITCEHNCSHNCDNWWHNSGKYKVKNLIADELRPSFFESLLREARFTSEINSAVSCKLPSILANRSDELIKPFVTSQVNSTLPSLLNNNHYIQSQLMEQSTQFNSSLTRQKDEFKRLCSDQQAVFDQRSARHKRELEDISNDLIKSSVNKLTNENEVIREMKASVKENLLVDINYLKEGHEREIRSLKEEHNREVEQQRRTIDKLEERLDNHKGVIGVTLLLSVVAMVFSIFGKN